MYIYRLVTTGRNPQGQVGYLITISYGANAAHSKSRRAATYIMYMAYTLQEQQQTTTHSSWYKQKNLLPTYDRKDGKFIWGSSIAFRLIKNLHLMAILTCTVKPVLRDHYQGRHLS